MGCVLLSDLRNHHKHPNLRLCGSLSRRRWREGVHFPNLSGFAVRYALQSTLYSNIAGAMNEPVDDLHITSWITLAAGEDFRSSVFRWVCICYIQPNYPWIYTSYIDPLLKDVLLLIWLMRLEVEIPRIKYQLPPDDKVTSPVLDSLIYLFIVKSKARIDKKHLQLCWQNNFLFRSCNTTPSQYSS